MKNKINPYLLLFLMSQVEHVQPRKFLRTNKSASDATSDDLSGMVGENKHGNLNSKNNSGERKTPTQSLR